jgi:hypothetical protein
MLFYLILFLLCLQINAQIRIYTNTIDINNWLNKSNNNKKLWYDFNTNTMISNESDKKIYNDLNNIEKKYIVDIIKEKINIINYELYKYKTNKELLENTNNNLNIVHKIIEKLNIHDEVFNFIES